MKAVYLEWENVGLEDCPEPKLRTPFDVKVKICYASICGYDMMVYRGAASPAPDRSVGHESSGIVVEVGAQVTSFCPGDHVTFHLFIPCGTCIMCRRNMPSYCTDSQSNSSQMREYVVCDQSFLQLLGPKLSLKAGCLIEPLTMGMRCLEKANLSSGRNALILGGGAMGLLMLKLIKLHPIASVAVADPSPKKRELALSFGSDAVFDPFAPEFFKNAMDFSDSLGYDSVIEASASQSSTKLAFHFLGRGGHLVYFGLYGMNYELPLNLFNLYWKDAFVSAVYPSFTIFQNAVDIAPRLALEELITAVFPFECAADAFREKAGGKHAKVMLDFTDGRFKG